MTCAQQVLSICAPLLVTAPHWLLFAAAAAAAAAAALNNEVTVRAHVWPTGQT